jgi:hypothetical protein
MAPAPLPELTAERLIERVAEAIRIGLEPERLDTFPGWTQRVMRILKEQFVPREFSSILSSDQSVFAEGIAVAWAARARGADDAPVASDGRLARKVAERLHLDAATQEAAAQVESGAIVASDEFQRHVMARLFASNIAERRAFAEGLAMGNRLHELLDGQARRSTTDATGVYLMLWFYWPEISRLRSIGEVARVLEPMFATNKNVVGAQWDERIRKLANRLGLSFRSKPTRTKRLQGK